MLISSRAFRGFAIIVLMASCSPRTEKPKPSLLLNPSLYPNESREPNGLIIKGSHKYQECVRRGLAMLARDPESLDLVRQYIGIVEEKGEGGLRPYETPPAVGLDEKHVCPSDTWCAAGLVIEAFRSKAYHDYLINEGRPVPHAYWKGKHQTLLCYERAIKTLKAIQAPFEEIEYLAGLDGSVANSQPIKPARQEIQQETSMIISCSPAKTSGITIIGTKDFVDCVNQAMRLLSEKDTEAAHLVCEFIGRIEQGEPFGMRPAEDPPTLGFTRKMACLSNTWCAATLVHEATHSKKYHGWKTQFGLPVPRRVWGGIQQELLCNQRAIETLKILRAPMDEIAELENDDGCHDDLNCDGIVTNEEEEEWSRQERD
jgi:hypothetical protein